MWDNSRKVKGGRKKMKKGLIVIAFALLTVFMAAGSASAWHRHHTHFGFGFSFAPPIVVAPPPVYYYPPYDYGYYYRSYKTWVPGYWSWQRAPYGAWERAWIPGYWGYR